MSRFSMTRRSFAKTAAVAATAALMNPAEALAQSSQPKPDKPLAQKAQVALDKLTARSRAEVEMKVAEIIRKYGDRLSDEQKTDVLRVMAESQPGLDKMRAFLLQNGDQPATVFHAYREASADSGTSLATGKKTKGKK